MKKKILITKENNMLSAVNKKNPCEYFSFRTFGKIQDNAIFFFTAFTTRYWWYYPVIRKLTKAGYYVIVYDIDVNIIFHGEIDELFEMVDLLIKNIKGQVSELKEQGVKKFFSFGVSMGTIFAMRIAVDIPDIKKVVVNVTYGSLADNIWTWSVLKRVKKRLMESGINKAKLEKLLEPISPLSMAPKLKGKKVLLYLAKRDKVILFEQSLQFKKALDVAGVDYVYHQNNIFGHTITFSINNLRSKIYLDFLKQA